MKFNWGTGIFLAYGCFAAAMITAVVKSTQFDNSLVVEDYYAKDIQYQETMDAMARSQNLKQPLQLNKVDGMYQLVFPMDELTTTPTGQVQFYRADSKRYDRYVPIELREDGIMLLSTTGLIPGSWELKIQWNDQKRSFYDTFSIYLSQP